MPLLGRKPDAADRARSALRDKVLGLLETRSWSVEELRHDAALNDAERRLLNNVLLSMEWAPLITRDRVVGDDGVARAMITITEKGKIVIESAFGRPPDSYSM